MIYAGDTGRVPRCAAAGEGREGAVALHYGHFPAEKAVVDAVGTGYDVFISKNTLKRGYIHPELEVDSRMLVHLKVDDETFVRAVYDLLKPGGILIASFKDSSKYSTVIYHWLIEWNAFRQRAEQDILALYEKAGFPARSVATTRTASEVIVFYNVSK